MQASDWDDRYRSTELLWKAEPNRFLPDLVRPLAAGTALDVACGEGRNSLWLEQQGWTVTGVDFSPVAIAKAEDWAKRINADVTFVNADLEIWTPDSSFNLIIEFYLHVPSDVRTRIHHRIAPFLAPGGSYVVLGHHLDNLTEGVGGPQNPELLFTEAQVAADFPDLRAKRVSRLERPTPTGTAIDALYVGMV